MNNEIVQISAIYNPTVDEEIVFGLGKDNKTYWWSAKEECWKLFTSKNLTNKN